MSKLETAIRTAGSAIQITEDGFSKKFVFDADFIGFNGHFPGNPILPAVVQIMTGAETAIEAAGAPLRPGGVSRAKFLKQIRPGNTLVVSGTLKPKGNKTFVAITIEVEGETAATFIVTMTEGQE